MYSKSEINNSYNIVAKSTKSASSNFYYAFKILPREKRNAIYSGYAFCRLVDDIVDKNDNLPKTNIESQLLDIENKLDDCVKNKKLTGLWIALGETLRKHPKNLKHLKDVIDGCRMDLSQKKYKNFSQLTKYCKKVASSTGLAMIEVFGVKDSKAHKYATDLGIALQLTNILRDIKEDFKMGRFYLPEDELRNFKVSKDEILSGEKKENVIEFMEFQAKRVRDFFTSGEKLLPLINKKYRFCPEIMKNIYFEILTEIEKNNFDVINKKIKLSKTQKIKIILPSITKNFYIGLFR